MPDNLIDKDLLKYYDGKLKTQANILQRDTSYILGQFVYRGNIFLRCKTAGTTDTTALNLTGVSIGDNLTDGTCEWVVFDPFATTISDWQTGNKYFAGDFVIKNDILYECITDNNDATFNFAKWKPISKDGVNAWQSNKQYALYDLAVEDEELYMCISPHTSSSDFQIDLDAERWKLIGGGDWNQVTKMNVVAPLDVNINISYTNTFKRPPVEVLKYEPGLSDNTTNVLSFSAGDDSKFEIDGIAASESPLITFDGVAKPNHEVLYPFGTPIQMNTKYYSESDSIDLDDYVFVDDVSLEGNTSLLMPLYVKVSDNTVWGYKETGRGLADVWPSLQNVTVPRADQVINCFSTIGNQPFILKENSISGRYSVGNDSPFSGESSIAIQDNNNALTFSSDYVNVTSGEEFTLAFWFKEIGNQEILFRGNDNNNLLYVGGSFTTVKASNVNIINIDSGLNHAEWTYIVLTRNASGLYSLYDNGVLQGSYTLPGNFYLDNIVSIYALQKYLYDLVILNYCMVTGNFTPPTGHILDI